MRDKIGLDRRISGMKIGVNRLLSCKSASRSTEPLETKIINGKLQLVLGVHLGTSCFPIDTDDRRLWDRRVTLADALCSLFTKKIAYTLRRHEASAVLSCS